VFIAVSRKHDLTTKGTIILDVAPYNFVEIHRRFGDGCCLLFRHLMCTRLHDVRS